MVTDTYRPVPVEEAKRLSDLFHKSQIVILSYDPTFMLTHTTTYGVSAFDKENAAAVGQKLTLAVGADLSKRHDFEDFHKDYDPAIYKESLELLKQIRSRNGCNPQMVQQAERILKAAGFGIRQG